MGGHQTQASESLRWLAFESRPPGLRHGASAGHSCQHAASHNASLSATGATVTGSESESDGYAGGCPPAP